MTTKAVPRVLIGAANSGAGKTTITCALIKALLNRGLKVSSFKCGPDYIDPMFHRKVLGVNASNLDIFMSGEEGIRYLAGTNSEGADISIMEGVMGLYDGMGFDSDLYSSNHVSLATDTPVILIINVRGMSFSAGAIAKGFANYKRNNIKAFILNNCSEKIYADYKALIEECTGIPVIGHMPTIKNAEISSRHLGLVTADEIEDINEKLSLIGRQASLSVDIDRLINIAGSAPPLTWNDDISNVTGEENVAVAVSRDEAFCFIYEDNLRLLERMGVKIKYFSPIHDSALPEDVSGMMLFGGYPELYLRQLEDNLSIREDIKEKTAQGMPVYAECGGFMYLMKGMTGSDGIEYELCGVIDSTSRMTDHLVRFGYQTLEADEDSMLFKKGETVNVHEFHYSDSTDNGRDLTAHKKGKSWKSSFATDRMYAGYPHINFTAYQRSLERFIQKCAEYEKERK